MKNRIQPSELLTVRRREDGQILVMGLFMIVGLVLAAFSVVNVGMMVSERVRVQNAVDASAYSSAVVQARYMNLAAYVNRAIVANYNSMAFNMGLWATVDAFDHGSAAAVGTLYGIASVFSETGVAYFLARTTSGINKGFHKPMHSFNRTLLSALGDNDFNQYIERYNTDVLSMYQGILLAAAQGIRYQVAQNVAATMDPDVKTTTLLGLGAEASNFDELRSAVDYAIGDVNRSNGTLTNLNKLFDSLGGEARPDTQLMLASINETSLDRFAGGRLRKSGKQDFLRNMNTGDLLDDWVVKMFIYPIHLGCEIASDLADIFGAGWHCDDDFSMTLGAMQRWGGEKAPDQVRAPIFTNNRIRQGNEFGVWYAFAVRILKHDWVDFGNIIGGQPMGGNWHFYGYGSLPESSEKAHIAHMSDIRHNFSWDNPCYTFDDLIRSIFGGADPSNCYTASSSMCQLNKANACLAEAFFALPHQSSFTLDAHWDGNFSQQAAGGPNVVFEWIDWPSGPVAVGQYDASIWSEGGPSRVNHGVAPYQMKTPLHRVAFANYTYPSTNELSNRGSGNSYAQDSYHGPSVTVVGVKAADKVRTIKYRKLKNPFPITAIARAQVYYQKSPNRPYESPSLFNPHWNARLAPLRDANAPWFARRLLPFMQSGGISLESTH